MTTMFRASPFIFIELCGFCFSLSRWWSIYKRKRSGHELPNPENSVHTKHFLDLLFILFNSTHIIVSKRRKVLSKNPFWILRFYEIKSSAKFTKHLADETNKTKQEAAWNTLRFCRKIFRSLDCNSFCPHTMLQWNGEPAMWTFLLINLYRSVNLSDITDV